MALANLSNLYSGAAQVFNNAPHLQFQARLLMQHRAKQDALENYYRKLPLTINEKGTRNNDRASINRGKAGLMEFWLKNKDKLRNGDGEAAYDYENLIREQQDLVQRSQNAGLTNMQVGKLFLNPKTSYVSADKTFMDKLHAHDLSVDDPNHVGLDLDEIMLPPPPYDRTAYFKNFAQMKGNENVSVFRNLDGVTQTVVNAPSYDEPQKQYVMSVAADKYLHDPSFKEMVNNDLGAADATNPLNADFKDNFGHDIQTPIDLATAYTFNGLKPEPIKEKIQTDQLAMLNKRTAIAYGKMAQQDFYARRRQNHADALIKDRIKFRSAVNKGEQQGITNEFLKQSFDAGTNKVKGTTVEGMRIGGKVYKGKFIDVFKEYKDSKAIFGGYKKDKQGQDTKEAIWKYPAGIFMSDDGKTIIPTFFTDKKTPSGNFYIDTELSKPESRQFYETLVAKKLSLGKSTGWEVIDKFDALKEMTDDLQDDKPQPPQPTPSTKVTSSIPEGAIYHDSGSDWTFKKGKWIVTNSGGMASKGEIADPELSDSFSKGYLRDNPSTKKITIKGL